MAVPASVRRARCLKAGSSSISRTDSATVLMIPRAGASEGRANPTPDRQGWPYLPVRVPRSKSRVFGYSRLPMHEPNWLHVPPPRARPGDPDGHRGAAPPAAAGVHGARVRGPAPTHEVRVLIATGHALVRAGYRALLENATGIEIAAEASTADEAISLAHWSETDVVLLDSALPGRDLVQAIREITDLTKASVIVLTSGEDGDSAFVLLRAGAAGFLLMDCAPHELVQAVQAVADGEAALSPSIARRLIARFAAQPDVGMARDGLEELTAREREVMALAARGLNNVEIGEGLGVSPATAKTHINRAMMQLCARDRAQLVAFAYESGLVAVTCDEPQPVGAPGASPA